MCASAKLFRFALARANKIATKDKTISPYINSLANKYKLLR